MKSETLNMMATEEYRFNRPLRAQLLLALGYILGQAENPNNSAICFLTEDIGHGTVNKGVLIQSIDALCGMSVELGSDFNPAYMLSGMQAATSDEYDGYCMSVLITHDLNSAKIPNLSELVYRLRMIDR